MSCCPPTWQGQTVTLWLIAWSVGAGLYVVLAAVTSLTVLTSWAFLALLINIGASTF